MNVVVLYPFDLFGGSMGNDGYGQVPIAIRQLEAGAREAGADPILVIDPGIELRGVEHSAELAKKLRLVARERKPACVFCSYDGGDMDCFNYVLDCLSDCLIIVGGKMPALYPERFAFKNRRVGVGDADLVAYEVCGALLRGDDVASLPCLTDGARRAVTFVRKSWDNKPELSWFTEPWENKLSVLMESSAMTCNSRCAFCCESRYADAVGARTAKFDARQITDAARRLSDDFGTEEFGLLDADCLADRPRALQLFRCLSELPKKLSFHTWASPLSLARFSDDELISASHAGMGAYHIGFESFSDAQLERYRKPASADANKALYKRMARLAVADGPYFDPLLVLWDPLTTPGEVCDNFSFLASAYACPCTPSMPKLASKLYCSPFMKPFGEFSGGELWTDEWDFADERTARLHAALRYAAMAYEVVVQEYPDNVCRLCDRGTAANKFYAGLADAASAYDCGNNTAAEDILNEATRVFSVRAAGVSRPLRPLLHSATKLSKFTGLSSRRARAILGSSDRL